MPEIERKVSTSDGGLTTRMHGTCSAFQVFGGRFGPYQVKDDVKKRVTLKVWGAVFCFMASRAIHVELINSVSTEGFLFKVYALFKVYSYAGSSKESLVGSGY